jgi:2-polyprenyl-6-methoxyphenol hydroxylase-like FAD-dependent oxidoreductase
MDADVIVVGAGPTGLLLAGDLAEAGARVMVLERRAEESNLTRAFAVHARTMEQLRIRGIDRELAATGTTVSTLNLFGTVNADLSGLDSEFNSVLITPQSQTERVLAARAHRLGARILHGSEVTGLTQDEHRVRVTTPDAVHTARYVVGADGVHSAVRRAIGLPYPGRSVIKSIMLADVRMSTPPPNVLTVNGVGDAFAFIAPFGDGWYRIFAWNRRNQVDDHAPLELAEIQETTRRALGTDFGMHDPRFLSRFHSDERQVPRYRIGRVFLAGDAAHCHSPAGGQGMNTGLQDAANLGWKLAAALAGWGGQDLLDSYHDERHPVGKAVLRSSGALVRAALIGPAWARWMRGLAGRTLLSIPQTRSAFVGAISGIGLRYPAPTGSPAAVGTRAPDLPLRHGTLYDALHGGRFALVGFDADQLQLPEQVLAAAPTTPMATDPLTLVRPDGYIGWIGTPDKFRTWANNYFSPVPQPTPLPTR